MVRKQDAAMGRTVNRGDIGTVQRELRGAVFASSIPEAFALGECLLGRDGLLLAQDRRLGVGGGVEYTLTIARGEGEVRHEVWTSLAQCWARARALGVAS